jgi:hypothetical protein
MDKNTFFCYCHDNKEFLQKTIFARNTKIKNSFKRAKEAFEMNIVIQKKHNSLYHCRRFAAIQKEIKKYERLKLYKLIINISHYFYIFCILSFVPPKLRFSETSIFIS